ncbi:MAG: hypothetical protein DI570_12945 [Phenylobacterium zucineum]|nr:MAG: hypothetical protein DI570_12945 [Phenylobacterium zucineum]
MTDLHPGELAHLQHEVLVAALGGGALPDLQLARGADGVALSKANLAEPVDLSDLPQPVRLIPAGAEAAHLAFTPPSLDAEGVTLALQVRAAPPDGGATTPLSAVTLRFRRDGEGWAPDGPPAALST